MHAFLRLMIFTAIAALASLAVCAKAPNGAERVSEIMDFRDWNGPAIRVYLLRPENAGPDAPVVFVMHGVNRDADRYFAEWRPFAEKYGFILVVPEFPVKKFPGAANYNLGGILDAKGAMTSRKGWAFSVIEPIFDEVVKRLHLTAGDYILYGHSAGAQFAHRFAMFGAGERARMVISANAGWYTFPGRGEWPYGPDGLPAGLFDQAMALGAPLTILAGEADADPMHPSLRRTPEANAQGATRYERAIAFYNAGLDLAAETNANFHWSCITAPGVDHDDAKAAPYAVALILFPSKPVAGPCRRGVAAE